MASKKKKAAPSPAATVLPREYEAIYIMRSSVEPDAAQSIAERVQALIDEGGKILRVDNWGRRRLAYPIGGSSRGVYVCLRFVGDPSLVAEIERQLKLVDDVIRYQTVLIKRDVAIADYEVAAEDVAFAPVEPAPEDDEPGFAQRLGLVEPPPKPAPPPRPAEGEAAAEGAATQGAAEGEAPAGAAAAKPAAEAGAAEAAPEGGQPEEAQPEGAQQ
jgi:small subunit ribosomal protein S6